MVRIYIFLLKAVMSREALITRSRLSWCSSSSARNVSNMGMYGDVEGGLEAMAFVVFTSGFDSCFIEVLVSSAFVSIRGLLGSGDMFGVDGKQFRSE